MNKLWVTYAWKDNEDRDIDYIFQELDKTCLDVRFDRRNLVPGQRLWAQIGGIITDPNECDAWGIVLTYNSIQSQPCMEELSYALDRALNSNEDNFPLFALLHNISPSQLPPALKVRLSILLSDTNWVDQVVAAVKKIPSGFDPSGLGNFVTQVHTTPNGYALEIGSRFERITNFSIAVDLDEKTSGNVTGWGIGPAGIILSSGYTMHNVSEGNGTLTDGTDIWFGCAGNEVSSVFSCYLFCKSIPKRIWCGTREKMYLISCK